MDESPAAKAARLLKLQLDDLGLDRSSHITAAEGGRRTVVVPSQLEGRRRANIPGTAEFAAARAIEPSLAIWAHLYEKLEVDGATDGKEDLAGGQSHRVKLNQQMHHEQISAHRGSRGSRGGRASGRGGGVIGTRGRGAHQGSSVGAQAPNFAIRGASKRSQAQTNRGKPSEPRRRNMQHAQQSDPPPRNIQYGQPFDPPNRIIQYQPFNPSPGDIQYGQPFDPPHRKPVNAAVPTGPGAHGQAKPMTATGPARGPNPPRISTPVRSTFRDRPRNAVPALATPASFMASMNTVFGNSIPTPLTPPNVSMANSLPAKKKIAPQMAKSAKTDVAPQPVETAKDTSSSSKIVQPIQIEDVATKGESNRAEEIKMPVESKVNVLDEEDLIDFSNDPEVDAVDEAALMEGLQTNLDAFLKMPTSSFMVTTLTSLRSEIARLQARMDVKALAEIQAQDCVKQQDQIVAEETAAKLAVSQTKERVLQEKQMLCEQDRMRAEEDRKRLCNRADISQKEKAKMLKQQDSVEQRSDDSRNGAEAEVTNTQDEIKHKVNLLSVKAVKKFEKQEVKNPNDEQSNKPSQVLSGQSSHFLPGMSPPSPNIAFPIITGIDADESELTRRDLSHSKNNGEKILSAVAHPPRRPSGSIGEHVVVSRYQNISPNYVSPPQSARPSSSSRNDLSPRSTGVDTDHLAHSLGNLQLSSPQQSQSKARGIPQASTETNQPTDVTFANPFLPFVKDVGTKHQQSAPISSQGRSTSSQSSENTPIVVKLPPATSQSSKGTPIVVKLPPVPTATRITQTSTSADNPITGQKASGPTSEKLVSIKMERTPVVIANAPAVIPRRAAAALSASRWADPQPARPAAVPTAQPSMDRPKPSNAQNIPVQGAQSGSSQVAPYHRISAAPGHRATPTQPTGTAPARPAARGPRPTIRGDMRTSMWATDSTGETTSQSTTPTVVDPALLDTTALFRNYTAGSRHQLPAFLNAAPSASAQNDAGRAAREDYLRRAAHPTPKKDAGSKS